MTAQIGDIYKYKKKEFSIVALSNAIQFDPKDYAIKWIMIKCDEGILYIATDHFTGVVLFMSEYELAKEEVMHVGSYTKGLRKIEFLG